MRHQRRECFTATLCRQREETRRAPTFARMAISAVTKASLFMRDGRNAALAVNLRSGMSLRRYGSGGTSGGSQ